MFINRKLFDIRNPNCIIKTPIKEISNMLTNVPAVLLKESSQEIFGCIKEVTKVTECCAYGDILVFNNLDLNKVGDFYNYEIFVDDVRDLGNNIEITVLGVGCVIFNNKEDLIKRVKGV